MESRLKRLTLKKQQLDRLRPLPDSTLKQLDEWLRVELTYSSNAIEGNTLTRLETAEILDKGVSATVGAKPLRDQLEAINHAKALGLVHSLAHTKHSHQFITESDIKAIHKLILHGIDDEWAGQYRQSEVFVKGASVTFPSSHNVPYKMDEFIQWLEGEHKAHPVRIAADAHFKLVTIHPFVDGNGRTARLLMNLILLINGYPVAVIRNEDRTTYLEAVNRGQTQNNLSAFYTLIETAVQRSLDAYLAAGRGKPALHALAAKARSEPRALLRIGQLAQATGETIHTLRYWAQIGLLQVQAQTPGGYQLFHPNTVERVRRIRHLQQVKRLTLAEIKRELQAAA